VYRGEIVTNLVPTIGCLGGFELLQKAVASGAFHDAGDALDPPKCHPNTRTAVINRIMDWILGLGAEDQNAVILWFYGPAGAGKSAIAHNIADRCELESLLLASFFFSRSDPARSNSKSLIATISYQIAINIPGTREKVVTAIERDPLILSRSLETQVAILIVEPLREPLEAGYFNAPTSRRLIIIDGLDECDPPAVQCSILEVISRLFRDYRLPLLVFIASRPERHLTHCFSTGSLPEFHTTLALDNTYKPHDDIRLFLADNFSQVKATHPMKRHLDHSWPSDDVLESLVHKSSGQFIYASTVVKYVSSIRHQPANRLKVVLGIRPSRHVREMPFGELDALYRHIFTSVEDRETVLLILGFEQLPLSQRTIMDAEALEDFLLLNRGDVEMLLGDLSAVITISDDHPFIRILHASLGDFLLDSARSKEFYIDLSSILTACMQLCFQHIKQCMSTYFPSIETMIHLHRIDLESDDDGGRRHFLYAGANLIWHCENTPPSAYPQLHEEIRNFSFRPPDSCFKTPPGMNFIVHVPQFLEFIKDLVCPIFFACPPQYIEHIEQPIEDADQLYNQNLSLVLDFFASKLPLYYSSSRLTLLLTFLPATGPNYFATYIIPLPSRLEIADDSALGLHGASRLWPKKCYWKIFQDFLGSGDPLALDQRRYAIASFACLKILFGHYQAPVLRFTWFSRHSRTLRVDMEGHSQRHHTDLPVGAEWWSTRVYWDLRTRLPNQMRPGKPLSGVLTLLEQSRRRRASPHYQSKQSKHLQFLLPKSACSDNILDFARYRVFRFGYLAQHHPVYIKKAIFSLAKYIQRVTGETAEVRACESIWGRDRWFTAE